MPSRASWNPLCARVTLHLLREAQPGLECVVLEKDIEVNFTRDDQQNVVLCPTTLPKADLEFKDR